jgi:hypothetical protein
MSKQNYVGQYFINNVDQAGFCVPDFGQCIWQDSKNLLCARHEKGSCGQAWDSILLMPARLAKKIKWYAVFDEFDNALAGDPNGPLEITMTSKERDGVPSIRVPEYYMDILDILWGGRYDLAGNCVATLAWWLRERPDVGMWLADYLAAEAAKHKARKATIEAIAKMIADAGLSADEVVRLALGIHLNNEEKSRVQAEG